MTLKIHSYVSLEVLYMFRKVPTSLWLLVDVQTFIYIIFSFNHVSMAVNYIFNLFGWSFPEISSQATISCEPLLNKYI